MKSPPQNKSYETSTIKLKSNKLHSNYLFDNNSYLELRYIVLVIRNLVQLVQNLQQKK